MFKHLQRMLLIAAICVPWVTQAQSSCTPISTFPVTYGFEASEGFTNAVTSVGAACTTNVFNSCWRNVQTSFGSTSTTTSGRLWSIYGGTTTAQIHSGSQSLVLPDKGTSSTVSTTMLTFPAMDFTSSNGYVVSFWIYRNGTGTSTPEGFKIYASPTDTIGPNAVELGHYSRHCTLPYPVVESAAGWYQYETAPITMTGTVYIIFEGQSYYSNSTYVDDVIIMETPTCPKPQNLLISDITSSGATVSWTPTGSETLWEIVCDGQSYFSADTFYTFNTLSDNTPYDVYVRAVCGADDSSLFIEGSFRTACNPLSELPYFNDFENEPYYQSGTTSYADAFPHCWTRINDATGTYNYYPYINTSATYLIHGSKSMYWYHTTSATYADNEYAVLPPIDLDVYDISDLTLSFYAKTTATAAPYPQFIVGVMSDVTDATTFTALDTVTLTATPTMYVVSLAGYTGTGNLIAIRCPRTSSSRYASLDDVFLTDTWCNIPDSVTATPTTTSITVSWEANGGTSFAVALGEDTVYGVTDTFYTFNNLTPMTPYHYGVAGQCGTATSLWVGGSVFTSCAQITELPYVNGFEDEPYYLSGTTTYAEAFPHCWTRINDATGTYNYYPYINSSATYVHSGGKGMYWYHVSTASYANNQYAVLPPVDLQMFDMEDLTLAFYAKTTSATYHPQPIVGVMTDPADTSTFVPVYTFSATEITTTWQLFSVSFENYTDSGSYIAIKWPRPGSTCYLAIDDVVLSEGWCDIPGNVTAFATAESVTVTWEPGEGSSFTAYVGDDTINNIADTFYTFYGLTADTVYNYGVATECGNNLSVFVEGTVQTLCASIDQFPWTETFDSVANINDLTCWNRYTGLYNDTASFSLSPTTSGWTLYNAHGMEGSKHVKVNIYGTACKYWLMSPPFEIGNDLVFSFDYSLTTYNNDTPIDNSVVDDRFIVFAVTEDNSYIPLAKWGCDSTRDNYSYEAIPNTGTNFSASLANFVGQNVRFAFYGESTVSGDDNDLHVDNVYIGEAVTCQRPSMVQVSDITSTSATVSWVDLAYSGSYVVEYYVSGTTGDTVVETVTDTTLYLTALTPNTEYVVNVMTDCGELTAPRTITFRTSCSDISALPWIENFDGFAATSSATNIPCWNHIGGGYVNFVTSGTHVFSGTSVRFYPNNSTVGNVLVLPSFEAPISTLEISLMSKPEGASSGSFSVGYVTDPMQDSTFVEVQEYPISHFQLTPGATTVSYVCLTNTFAGAPEGARIALRHNVGTTSWYWFIDSVNVHEAPACLPVTMNAPTVTDNSITLSWSAAEGQSSWLVTGDDNYSTVVNDTTVTISGLAANTNYTFNVYALCTGGDSSDAVTVQARTACGLMTSVPFFEDFESYQTYSSSSSSTPFIPCWTRLNNGTTYAGVPYVSGSTSSYNHTPGGSKYTYWYINNTATYGDYLYMILPQIDTDSLPINTLMLSFWGKTSSASYNMDFDIGVMDSITDTAITVINTAHVNGNTTWQEYVTDFSSYTGTGSYIAIRVLRTGSTAYAYLDDITLDVVPACPRVIDIVATNATTSSLSLSWTDTSSNAGWNVEYGISEFTPGTGVMTPIHVTDTFCVLSGLDSATTYHVYVYPDCDGTIFYTHAELTTLAASPATVPYSCDFEAEGPNGWDFVNGTQVNHWMVGNDVNNGGSRAMYITNNDVDNAYTITSISYVFATRTFNLAAGNYVCTYDWKAQGESSYDFIRVALVPLSTQFVAGEYCGFDNTTAMPEGGIALDGGYRMNLQGTWQNHVDEFSIATPGVYKMVFLWRNDGSGGTQPPAAIDNVTLTMNTCPMVDDLNGIVTDNSIDLSWTAGGNETSWIVTVGATSVVVNSPSYLASGLASDSAYTVSVRAICGVGDTSAARTVTLHTTCVAVSLPYAENFDSYTTSTTAATGVAVPCWNTTMTATGTYAGASYRPMVYYSATNAHSGSYSYRLYGNAYHALPPMPVDLTDLQISFWDYTTAANYSLEVGVMEGNNFIPVQTISSPTSTHIKHTVYFGSYTGNSRIIAFNNYNSTPTVQYSYHYIDDIEVDYLPTCPPVVSLDAVAAGVDNITIDWIDMAESTQMWQVRYGEAGGDTTTITATSHPVNIAGLDTLTTYSFQVRPICSATDTGEWCNAAMFSTELCSNAVAVTTGPATGTGNMTPVNNYYKYSLTETIIDSAELAGIGDIEAIAYNYAYSSPSTKKDSVTIWLQPTNKSVFSSSSDIVLLDNTTAVQVYSGSLNCSQGWNYFALDTVYTWDGHSNLLVIVDDNSFAYDGNAYVFRTSACDGYKTLAWYSDTQNPDPTSSTSSATKGYYQFRTNMKLVSCGASCPRPNLLPVSDVTYNAATVSWNGSATSFEVAVKASNEGLWPEATPVSTTSYAITGLQPATIYQYRVRAICDAAEGLISDWVAGTFTTDSLPCFAPTEFALQQAGLASATFSWTVVGEETAWRIRVWNASFDETYDVTTNPATVTGLSQHTTYNATVVAVCGGGLMESEESNIVEFTTAECPIPTDVAATNVDAHNATITWNGSASVYSIEYGRGNFATGSGTLVENISGTSYTITGLSDGVAYSVQVRAHCDAQNASAWSTRASFTTPEETGIDDVNGTNVSIYPNPTSGATTISLSGVNGEVTVTVVDMNGRTVRTETMDCAGDCTKRMEVSGLAAGSYFVRIAGEGVNTVKKLVVK